ncbi:hypothetical protein LV779_16240 [Streptomyces thinghirensis]|nr:hypothetical protein [Streptomyces thinghirensis]
MNSLSLQDIWRLRRTAAWNGYIRAFGALTAAPEHFHDAAGRVFDRYVRLQLGDPQAGPGAPTGRPTRWHPVVEVVVTLTAGTFSAVSGGGPVGADRGACCRHGIHSGDRIGATAAAQPGSGREEQRFAREIASVRLASDREWRQFLDLVQRLPGYRPGAGRRVGRERLHHHPGRRKCPRTTDLPLNYRAQPAKRPMSRYEPAPRTIPRWFATPPEGSRSDGPGADPQGPQVGGAEGCVAARPVRCGPGCDRRCGRSRWVWCRPTAICGTCAIRCASPTAGWACTDRLMPPRTPPRVWWCAAARRRGEGRAARAPPARRHRGLHWEVVRGFGDPGATGEQNVARELAEEISAHPRRWSPSANSTRTPVCARTGSSSTRHGSKPSARWTRARRSTGRSRCRRPRRRPWWPTGGSPTASRSPSSTGPGWRGCSRPPRRSGGTD